MPGPPPWRCHFPQAFLDDDVRMVRRRTVSVQDLQRYRLVLALHDNLLLSNAQAGYLVGLSARQVQRWKQRWQTGEFTIADALGRGQKPLFSPLDHAIVKALACETVACSQQPLSRQSLSDLQRRLFNEHALRLSRSTIWRILQQDVVKPWQYQHWLFLRACILQSKRGASLICTLGNQTTNLWDHKILC